MISDRLKRWGTLARDDLCGTILFGSTLLDLQCGISAGVFSALGNKEGVEETFKLAYELTPWYALAGLVTWRVFGPLLNSYKTETSTASIWNTPVSEVYHNFREKTSQKNRKIFSLPKPDDPQVLVGAQAGLHVSSASTSLSELEHLIIGDQESYSAKAGNSCITLVLHPSGEVQLTSYDTRKDEKMVTLPKRPGRGYLLPRLDAMTQPEIIDYQDLVEVMIRNKSIFSGKYQRGLPTQGDLRAEDLVEIPAEVIGSQLLSFLKTKYQSFFEQLPPKISSRIFSGYEGRASLDDFILDTFGLELDPTAIRRTLESHGPITSLRKIDGGYSSAGVVSLGEIVIKLDADLTRAEQEKKLLSLDMGEVSLYLPRPLSEKIEVLSGLAVWKMKNVSKVYQSENLFERSKGKRAPFTDASFRIMHELTQNINYLPAQLLARNQGAADLYDLLDHYMCVLGLFHTAVSNQEGITLNDNPHFSDPEQHRDRILTIYPLNLGIQSEISSLFSQVELNKILGAYSRASSKLRSGRLVKIHGDLKAENVIDGNIVDPSLRSGKEVEDQVRLLSDAVYALPKPIISHFINRYIQHRRLNDAVFESKDLLPSEMHELAPYALFVEDVRRVGAMQKRNLLNPENFRTLTLYLNRADQTYQRIA